MDFERIAPAKVNLFLHVGPRDAEGYHPICSLMTFASVGDVIHMRRGREMGFEVLGPFGEHLNAEGGDNLVVRARDAFLAAFIDDSPAFRLTLEKNLPIAAGLGGGSCDAAATLNLLADTLGAPWDSADAPALLAIAGRLGADVTACLQSVAVLARGRGEICDTPPVFPDLEAVLVNPGVPSPTGKVYGAFDAAAGRPEADVPEWPEPMQTLAQTIAFLQRCRNDLEAPAIGLAPRIGETLDWLRRQPETRFARMSGSGATCFALVESHQDALDLANRASDVAPWWAKPCRLAGFRP